MAVDQADELFAVCFEALAGRESRVASGESMRLWFNPQAVTSYRLLGHEAVTLTGIGRSSLSLPSSISSAKRSVTCSTSMP